MLNDIRFAFRTLRQNAALHVSCSADSSASHRRQRDHIQRRECSAAETPAIPRTQSHRSSRGKERQTEFAKLRLFGAELSVVAGANEDL